MDPGDQAVRIVIDGPMVAAGLPNRRFDCGQWRLFDGGRDDRHRVLPPMLSRKLSIAPISGNSSPDRTWISSARCPPPADLTAISCKDTLMALDGSNGSPTKAKASG